MKSIMQSTTLFVKTSFLCISQQNVGEKETTVDSCDTMVSQFSGYQLVKPFL